MKRRLNYITHDSWWDTDVDIIDQLKTEYDVYVVVRSSSFSDNKYPVKQIEGVNVRDFVAKYSNKNPLSIFLNIRVFFLLLVYRFKPGSLNYYVIGDNPLQQLFIYYLYPKKHTIIATHNFVEHVDGRRDVYGFKKKFYDNYKYFHFYSSIQLDLFRKQYPHNNGAFYSLMPLKDFGCPTGKYNIDKSNKIVFTFFGSTRAYKRPDLFIEAANALSDERAIFLYVGSANKGTWDRYKDLIKSKNIIEDIRFIDNDEIPAIFSTTDFLVLPYEDATQSGPSMIAINYGVPIIASDLPIFRRLIRNGENGFLFKVGDLNELIKVEKTALSLDENELAEMKRAQLNFKADYNKKNDVFKSFHTFIKEHKV